MINRTLFFSLMISVTFLFITSGCKDENVVENPNNNNNNQNPAAPELVEPVNNSVISSSTPILKWNAYANTVSYRVQLSFDANFIGTMFIDTSVNASTTELAVSNGLLITNVNYYWRVLSMQNSSNSNWSAVWKFSVILPPPPPPNLLLPPNGSSSQSFIPLFDWEDAPTAQTYRLQVSANQNFTNILFDTSRIPASEKQCPPMILNTNTQYYWRVNAANSNGLSTGEWAAPFSFTTVSGPEPNSISGTITFADTNFVHPPFYYISCVYTTLNWPPAFFVPDGIDSLVIQHSGGVYTASYKIRHLTNGTYYIAASTTDRNTPNNNNIYGTYGCDTARTKFSGCAFTPVKVTISGNNGVTGINFLSWADSTKVIFP